MVWSTEMTFGLLAIDVEMDGASMPRLMPDSQSLAMRPERLENVCAGIGGGRNLRHGWQAKIGKRLVKGEPRRPGTLDSGFPIAANVASMMD